MSGWAFYRDNDYVKSGVINHKDICDDYLRNQLMLEDFGKLISEYEPDAAFIEGVIWKQDAHRTIMLGQLAGMILGYCKCLGIRCGQIPANTWRRTIGMETGKGMDRKKYKEMAVQYVKEKLGIEVTDDEAEAICINLASQIIDKGA